MTESQTTPSGLSHRWIEQELNYDEMAELAKMEREERDENFQRNGYREIINCCNRPKEMDMSGCGLTLAV